MVPQLWPRSSCSTSAFLHHVLLFYCVVVVVYCIVLLLFCSFFVVVVVGFLGGRPLSCSLQVSCGLQFLRWSRLPYGAHGRSISSGVVFWGFLCVVVVVFLLLFFFLGGGVVTKVRKSSGLL